jgi:hypothetical protein
MKLIGNSYEVNMGITSVFEEKNRKLLENKKIEITWIRPTVSNIVESLPSPNEDMFLKKWKKS